MPLVIPQRSKPRAILGCMTFGPDESTGARITSLDDYKQCLDLLASEGYFEIDTARVYVGGKQEAFTSAAGYLDRGLTLATKWYPRADGDHEPAKVREALETSLKELGTKCVDIFYLHAADRATPFETTLKECDALFREGKFVKLGLSNFTAFEVAEVVLLCRQHGWVRPTIYQGVYNAIFRSIETELIVACRRYGLDIVVYNPLAGGLFSGKYSSKDLQTSPSEGRFSDKTSEMGVRYRERYFKQSTFEALKIAEEAAAKAGVTLLETAFRWLVHHSELHVGGNGKPGNDGIILGVSSLSQLKQNLKDIEKGPLPQELVDALDRAWMVSKAASPPYWHKDLKYTYDTKKALFG